MKQVLLDLAKEYRDKINIVIIDVDKNYEYVSKYGIVAIPTQIFFDEIVYDFFFKQPFEIDHVMRDSDLIANPAGIVDVFGGATTAKAFPALCSLIPKVHGQADDLMPLILQKGSSR